MIIIACIDDHNGMMFHKRRQSQDRLLREDMLRQCAGKKLYMNAYSHSLFLKDASLTREAPTEIIAAEDFFLLAGEEDFCFLETMNGFLAAAEATPSLLEQVQGVILYRWNRTYPADTYFSFDLAEDRWILTKQKEFAGSSHERITRETYQRKKGSLS